MRSFGPIYVCLTLAGLPAWSAPILVPRYEGSNTTGPGPGMYRIGTVIPQPSTGSLWLGPGPVNHPGIFGTGSSYNTKRSSGPLLSWLDPVKAPVGVTMRDISTDTSKGLTSSTLLETQTQPGEPTYTAPLHSPETTDPSKPHPLDLTTVLRRDGTTQPGGNVDPQDILTTFLIKIKEAKRAVPSPVDPESDPCAQYPWDYINQFGTLPPNSIYDHNSLQNSVVCLMNAGGRSATRSNILD